MASKKKMERLVFLARINAPLNLMSVFTAVDALSEAELLEEYTKVNNAWKEKLSKSKAEITSAESELE